MEVIRMMDFKHTEVWFVTGSQHLYGDAALKEVAEHSQKMARGLSESGKLPVQRDLQAGGDHSRGNL